MNTNKAEKTRAQNLSEYLSSLGLIDCWMSDDNRITHKGGNSRLYRIMYRLQGKYKEKLYCDWTFTAFDHCLLKLELNKEYNVSNRRILSMPTYILHCKEGKEKIERGLKEFQNMCNDQWQASV